MARILHVGDEPEWREVVQEALADHDLDLATGHQQAAALLRTGAPYDLAVVDLHRATDGAMGGGELGELVELLWTHYPDTRRVVVAAVPPRRAGRAARAGRAGLFARYGVEEVLTKSTTSAPDLRRIVETALEHEAAVEAPIRRAELRRRYQEWRSRQSAELEVRIRTAEIVARNTSEVASASRRGARAALEDALALCERFTVHVYNIGTRIERAVTVLEILDAADAFAHVEELYPEVGER
jgi:CheY-like chemotaxis protein